MLETFYAYPKNSQPLSRLIFNQFFTRNNQLHDIVSQSERKFGQNGESFDSGGNPYV